MEAAAATAPHTVYRINVFADRPGGCYTCHYFGERRDVAPVAHRLIQPQADNERYCALRWLAPRFPRPELQLSPATGHRQRSQYASQPSVMPADG